MEKEYQIGTFCKDIKCRKLSRPRGLSGNAISGSVHCKIVKPKFSIGQRKAIPYCSFLPQMSSKELAARLRGLDVVQVEG